jgi:hypothetical protein
LGFCQANASSARSSLVATRASHRHKRFPMSQMPTAINEIHHSSWFKL